MLLSDDNLLRTVNNEVTLSDSTRSGSVSTTTQTEHFQNGQYTTQTGGTTIENPEITEEIMQNYCRNLLIGSIPLPAHIKRTVITISDNSLTYVFTAKDELAELLRTNTCQTLYQSPDALDSVTSNYKTKELR